MRAAFYTRQGPSDVLQVGELPTPEPGPGEVRVRLRASGANPSDWKTRQGGINRPMVGPIIIPHSDGAGVIDAVGEGVSPARVGERVWLWNGQWKRPSGTAAEFIALPSPQAVTMPASLGFVEGACLGIPGLTATQAVRLAEAGPGRRILIAGGAGAVAHYAIQIAKARGATVLTTVSGEQKAAHARSAGADHAINYRTEDVGSRVRALTDGIGVDAVIEMDLSSNAARYPQVLRPHGRVVVYGMSSGEATLPSLWLMQNSITLTFFLVYDLSPQDRTACLAALGELLDGGVLQHAIGLRLPLSDVARAHDLIEQGKVIGNVVLDIAN